MPRIMEVAAHNKFSIESISASGTKFGRCFPALHGQRHTRRQRTRTARVLSDSTEENQMTELEASTRFGFREVKRYLRDRTRIVSSFVQPLLWLVIFGAGFGIRFALPGGSYQTIYFPRHSWSDAAVHGHVHGHIGHLGQGIWLPQRSSCGAGFPHDAFPGQNGG